MNLKILPLFVAVAMLWILIGHPLVAPWVMLLYVIFGRKR